VSPLLLGVALYVAAQFAVGIWVSRRVRTEDDYFVAGRRLGLGLATFSIFATWFGAETCVGAAGEIYSEGVTRTTVEPFAYGLCLVIMGLVFAAPFWRSKAITLADHFRARYSPAVERVAALLLIPTSIFWAAAQVRAFGQVLSSVTEIDAGAAVAVAATITILYTAAGGMLSDVITDLVQAIALIAGLGILALVVLGELGGAAGAWNAVSEGLAARPASELGALGTLEAWALPICGSVVAQEALSRAVSSRSATIARNAALGGGALYLAVGLIPVFLGLVGPRLLPDLADPEQLLPQLAATRLSTFFHVMFVGAIISAILSTVDSTLLVASSLLARNVLAGTHDQLGDRQRVWLARAGVAAAGVAAWILAAGSDGVMGHIEDASGFGSAGILVCVSFGLFTRFGGTASALSALLSGVAVWIVGHYLMTDAPYPYLCSLLAALAAFVVVGLATRRRSAPVPASA